MDNTLKYKDYMGSVETSIEDGEVLLYGKILFIRDTILYEADKAGSLKSEFEKAVDDYLETCKQINKDPDAPYSGTFNIRPGSERHRKIAIRAHLENSTLNSVVNKAIDDYLTQDEIVHHDHQVTHTVKIQREISLDPLQLQGEEIWEPTQTQASVLN